MKPEVKVGIVSLIGLLIFCIGIIWKSGMVLRAEGYPLYGKFQTVNGLLKNSEVRYRGYLIGRVTAISPNPKDIIVTLYVENGTKITKGTRLRVAFDGLIGEKYMEVMPDAKSNIYLKAGDTMDGYSTSSLVDFVDVGTQNLNETKQMLATFREIITSAESRKSMQETIINFGQMSKELNELIHEIHELVDKQRISNMVSNLDEFSTNLKRISQTLAVSGNYAFIQNINQAASSLKNSAGTINKLIATLDKDKNDIVQDLRSVLKTGAIAVESGTELIQKVNNVRFDLEGNMFSGSGTSYYEFGTLILNKDVVAGMGIGNYQNSTGIADAYVGKHWNAYLSTYVGLIRNSPSLAFGYYVMPKINVSAMVSNPSNMILSLRAKYMTDADLKFFLEGNDLFNAANTKYFIGVGF